MSVALQLLWRHTFAGDTVAPKNVWADAHTPKKPRTRPAINKAIKKLLDAARAG